MKRWSLRLILIASLVGVVGASIATHQYLEIQQIGFEAKSFCTINTFLDCDTAYASSHAEFLGIPLSWFGILFYLFSAGLALFLLLRQKEMETISSFGWFLSLGGVALSLYKAYVSLFQLQVLCLICLVMYVVNLLLFFSWHSSLGIGWKHWDRLLWKPKSFTLAFSLLLIFGIGGMGMKSYLDKNIKMPDLGVPIEELLPYHFRQSQYQLEVDPNAPMWGNPEAKVTVVEFSDFECPHCRRAAFHLKPILAEFKKDIRFVFYHFPIDKRCNERVEGDFHQKACLASFAATCAYQQGDFWSYHDDLFRDQKKLGKDFFLELAKKRGWDLASFEACMNSLETEKNVKSNITAGDKIYINATPTVLVNNRAVKYWSHPELLRAILKEEIKRVNER